MSHHSVYFYRFSQIGILRNFRSRLSSHPAVSFILSFCKLNACFSLGLWKLFYSPWFLKEYNYNGLIRAVKWELPMTSDLHIAQPKCSSPNLPWTLILSVVFSLSYLLENYSAPWEKKYQSKCQSWEVLPFLTYLSNITLSAPSRSSLPLSCKCSLKRFFFSGCSEHNSMF